MQDRYTERGEKIEEAVEGGANGEEERRKRIGRHNEGENGKLTNMEEEKV